MSFLNKVAIVTGASSGIGAVAAYKFAAEGAKVALVGRNVDKLKAVSEKCTQNGVKPLTIIADLSKEDSAKKIVDATLNQFGQLDVLVNNAGYGATTALLAADAVQIFDQIMATNLRSVVSLVNLAGPHLIKTKGNIVNISSTAGMATFMAPGFAYSTSKAALDHFTRCAATELGSKGVRVNAINPGPVDTDILKNMGLDEEQAGQMMGLMKRGTILKRISDPEEIADVILFLASERARGVTGSNYVVDNGTLLKR